MLRIPPRGKTLLYFGVFTHFLIILYFCTNINEVSIPAVWSSYEQDDLHPLPQAEWRSESWGAHRRWAFGRLQAFWHIAQHLAAAAKGRAEFRETLQQLLTLSAAAGNVTKFRAGEPSPEVSPGVQLCFWSRVCKLKCVWGDEVCCTEAKNIPHTSSGLVLVLVWRIKTRLKNKSSCKNGTKQSRNTKKKPEEKLLQNNLRTKASK